MRKTAAERSPGQGPGKRERVLPHQHALSSNSVGLHEVSPNEVTLTIPPPRTGMLVLLDNDYPGWRAADAATGRPLPLQRVDLTFRGVPLTAANGAVRLRYEPASFRLGLYLALLAIAALAGIGAGGFRQMRG